MYSKKGDFFQAKQTLQSIIDNYKGTDLVELAYEKLNAIMEMEKEAALKKDDGIIENDTIVEIEEF